MDQFIICRLGTCRLNLITKRWDVWENMIMLITAQGAGDVPTHVRIHTMCLFSCWVVSDCWCSSRHSSLQIPRMASWCLWLTTINNNYVWDLSNACSGAISRYIINRLVQGNNTLSRHLYQYHRVSHWLEINSLLRANSVPDLLHSERAFNFFFCSSAPVHDVLMGKPPNWILKRTISQHNMHYCQSLDGTPHRIGGLLGAAMPGRKQICSHSQLNYQAPAPNKGYYALRVGCGFICVGGCRRWSSRGACKLCGRVHRHHQHHHVIT